MLGLFVYFYGCSVKWTFHIEQGLKGEVERLCLVALNYFAVEQSFNCNYRIGSESFTEKGLHS